MQNKNINFDFTDAIKIKFDAIHLSEEKYKEAKTPAMLESIILEEHPIKMGDFIILEWEKFTEDILVTSDRSALISSQTCK